MELRKVISIGIKRVKLRVEVGFCRKKKGKGGKVGMLDMILNLLEEKGKVDFE